MNQCMICGMSSSIRGGITIRNLGLHAPILRKFVSLAAFEDSNYFSTRFNRLDSRYESILYSCAYSQDKSCNEFSKITTSKLFASSSKNIFRQGA